jgi:SAM-dependent methyltransferase
MNHALTVYEGANARVLSLVPPSALRILDVGCGTGTLGEQLRRPNDRYVAGITYSEEEAHVASTRLSEVICADLNQFDFLPLGKFDCVILSHILEHLYSPSTVLNRLKSVLEPDAVLIVALPNVVWWKQRLQFVLGRWRYQNSGILDRTHFRFFDRTSSEQLLLEAGYTILERGFDGPFPLIKPIRGALGSWADKVDRFTSRLAPSLLAHQFVYLAKLSKSATEPTEG